MDNYNFDNHNPQYTNDTHDNLGLYSLILGIVACFTSFVYYIGIICAVSCIVLAILSRNRVGRFEGKAIIGLCLGVSAIVLALMFFSAVLSMLQNPDLVNYLQTYMNTI